MDKSTALTISGVGLGTAFVFLYRRWIQRPPFPNSPTSSNPTKQGFSIKAASSHWDAIVIGSGIGGLTTAALLAKEGRRVLVLEQHDIAGGNLHTFSERGYEFDTGLHYVGGKVGEKTSPMRRQLDYVTDGQVEWERMDDVYDVVIVKDERFNIHSDWHVLKNDLKQQFPEECDAIDRFFMLVVKATRLFPVFIMLKRLPSPMFRLLLKLFGLSLFQKTTKQVLDSLTDNPKLAGVLAYVYGDYGEPPSRGAFAMHSLIYTHYKDGAWYPVGGPLKIAFSLIAVIEKWNGKVLVRAPVSSILIDDRNRAFGVEVKGKQIFAKSIISSVGAPSTFRKLVPDSHRKLVSPLIDIMNNDKIASNVTLMSMFVGINDPDGTLKLPKQNYWIYESWDHDGNIEKFKNDYTKPAAFFISFSSAKDPSYVVRNPGKHVALVIGPGTFDQVAKYRNKRVKHRGDEYVALKKQWEQIFMDALLNQFPQLSDRIDFVEFGTALSNDFYLGTYHGAVYGLAHTPERFMQQWLRPKTPIKNLFLTGQDICSCGIGGALIGGYLCAYDILPRCFLRTASMLG
jgi:all-trans-retinol 13,14-reductase